MSTKGIEEVLARAMRDDAFADQLAANPEKTLAGFELTDEEMARFNGMSRTDFETLAANPEERKSFTVLSRKAGGDSTSSGKPFSS